VLIANDDVMQLYVIENLFKNTERFETITKQNGHDAFMIFQTFLQFNKFIDLVILDLDMPIMGGCEACEKIKNLFHMEKLFS